MSKAMIAQRKWYIRFGNAGYQGASPCINIRSFPDIILFKIRIVMDIRHHPRLTEGIYAAISLTCKLERSPRRNSTPYMTCDVERKCYRVDDYLAPQWKHDALHVSIMSVSLDPRLGTSVVMWS